VHFLDKMAEIIKLENSGRYLELQRGIKWGRKCIQGYAVVKKIMENRLKEESAYEEYREVIESMSEGFTYFI